VIVRERFAIPLFREALIVQDYNLAGDIAGFHFSLSSKPRQQWKPSPLDTPDVSFAEMSLRADIDTVVISHLNHLINESMNWASLIRFAAFLRLDLGDWLLAVDRHEYLDMDQLVISFRALAGTLPGNHEEVMNLLVDGFRKADWSNHWRAAVIGFDEIRIGKYIAN